MRLTQARGTYGQVEGVIHRGRFALAVHLQIEKKRDPCARKPLNLSASVEKSPVGLDVRFVVPR